MHFFVELAFVQPKYIKHKVLPVFNDMFAIPSVKLGVVEVKETWKLKQKVSSKHQEKLKEIHSICNKW